MLAPVLVFVPQWGPLYADLGQGGMLNPIPGRMGDLAKYLFLGLLFATSLGGLPRVPKEYPEGFCQGCGYDMTGNVSGRCPECGKPYEPTFWQHAHWEEHPSHDDADGLRRGPDGE
jgi:hypothetical protein